MSDKYLLTLASDVDLRDGMGLLLELPDRTTLAEVFKDDETGDWTVTIFGDRPIPLADFQWFMEKAIERLSG